MTPTFEEIISEIRLRPELWQKSNPFNKSRRIRLKAWSELATKLNISDVSLKKRWKHLKDQFRKELRKFPGNGPETETDYSLISSWTYFHLMEFYKNEILQPKTVDSSTNDTPKNECTISQNVQSDIDSKTCDNIKSPQYLSTDSSIESAPSPSFSIPKRKRKQNLMNEMLEIERKKLDTIDKHMRIKNDESYDNNEDILFFRSILPIMKKMNLFQKLRFRGKVNDWLIEAMGQNHGYNTKNH